MVSTVQIQAFPVKPKPIGFTNCVIMKYDDPDFEGLVPLLDRDILGVLADDME